MFRVACALTRSAIVGTTSSFLRGSLLRLRFFDPMPRHEFSIHTVVNERVRNQIQVSRALWTASGCCLHVGAACGCGRWLWGCCCSHGKTGSGHSCRPYRRHSLPFPSSHDCRSLRGPPGIVSCIARLHSVRSGLQQRRAAACCRVGGHCIFFRHSLIFLTLIPPEYLCRN